MVSVTNKQNGNSITSSPYLNLYLWWESKGVVKYALWKFYSYIYMYEKRRSVGLTLFLKQETYKSKTGRLHRNNFSPKSEPVTFNIRRLLDLVTEQIQELPYFFLKTLLTLHNLRQHSLEKNCIIHFKTFNSSRVAYICMHKPTRFHQQSWTQKFLYVFHRQQWTHKYRFK